VNCSLTDLHFSRLGRVITFRLKEPLDSLNGLHLSLDFSYLDGARPIARDAKRVQYLQEGAGTGTPLTPAGSGRS
jgi:hypothetical protein